ncbi:uncharacterized protein LOC111028556 [Myzus persicae]|uniref:uncharacterized protein LOC111028556 n=1 Tax=Myzus persicae TaxID=13164 RepID=UPI000B937F57|nr:uncharacterized protein LOC111028556 [Myzus persicae]
MKLKLILLVLHIDFILGTIDENSTYWTGKLQRCGPKLAAELAIICRGIYNEATNSNPPTPQTNSNPIIKRGVADDCCLAMCTRRYIKNNYCGPEPELYVSSAQELREMVYVNYNYYYHDLYWIVLETPPPEE